MKQNIFVILLLFTSICFSQQYKPVDTSNYQKRVALTKQYETNFKFFNAKLKKTYKGKLREKILELYARAQKNFLKNIEKNKIIFDDRFQNYADSLLIRIVASNPNLELQNIRLYIARHNNPNALNFGDGTILLNMGLFKYLENEDQLISVITHEIGHQLLRHVEKNIRFKSKLQISDQKRIQAKVIRKQKFNSYEKAFTELKKIFYAEGQRHREDEMEADSIGYLLYRKTNLHPTAFINALKVLEKLDTAKPFVLKTEILTKVFNLPEQPFKKQWLQSEEFSQYDYSKYKQKIDTDSLRSHPEISKRIERLISSVHYQNDSLVSLNTVQSSSFRKLKQLAIQEDIANLHFNEKYGMSIYLTLKKISVDPHNKYYYKWLGHNFKQLYHAKKRYQLNRYVDRIIPDEQSESYKEFLSFIWNLRLEEIKHIADYYSREDS